MSDDPMRWAYSLADQRCHLLPEGGHGHQARCGQRLPSGGESHCMPYGLKCPSCDAVWRAVVDPGAQRVAPSSGHRPQLRALAAWVRPRPG